MKRILILTLMLLSLTACSGGSSNTDWLKADWKAIEDAGKGTTVRFYMYGGFAHVNKWIDTYVAQEMKKRYNITVERVPMDAGVFVNKLVTEKGAGKTEGTIDLLWINGENFKATKEAGALFGPYASKMPNFKYANAKLVANDFGYPTDGYETPYGWAQFVFEYDSAKVKNPPRSFVELLRWCRANPGKFTYPQPPDFTGSAFIRQVFYATTGGASQYMNGFDGTLFANKAPLTWKYLNALKMYQWNMGKSYPKDSAALDTLFARGEVLLNMSYHPLHAQSKILDGSYKPTVRTFVMKEGSIFNLHFTAIPFNAPNKPGAMLLANFLMSPDAQLSKFDPKNWGDYPAMDVKTFPAMIQAGFKKVDLGKPTLSPSDLSAVAVPEIPSDYLNALEKGWDVNVLH